MSKKNGRSDAFSILIYVGILVVGALIYGLVKDIGAKPPALTENDVYTVSMYFEGEDVPFEEAYNAWQKIEADVLKSNGW